ncbi:pre-mRNA-splicing factor 8 [Mucor velutinosus]|uniref:Pre-mRNA-splicing factor 8 n=1 Tax=Mucor velutinosus TaxID=708070 RepID=A0AAN7D516_9FUNG|nr:pre-mRNA-splicing factor 8 [Mucor velutinosus]
MSLPSEQDGSLNALQSDVDDSIDLNQFDEGYMNVSEEAYFLNATDEEYMTNDWSISQDPDLEECPVYASFSGEPYRECIIYNQLSANDPQTTIPPSVDSSYSSGFVQALCRSVRQVDEAFLVNVVMQLNAQQPTFSSVIDHNACALEGGRNSEQETEQARHEQLLMGEDVPLHHHQVQLNKLELIESEEIQRITGSAFNSEDHINERLGSSKHDLSGNDKPFMFEDDLDGKDFSSWLLYGSDDDMAAFKDVLSENASGDKPQSTVRTHTKSSSIDTPTANLHDDNHDKSTKEHTVPGSGSQANKASLDKKCKSDIVDNSEKEPAHRCSSKLLSNLGPMQCNSSNNQPRRQSPVLDTNGPSDAGFSFRDAIVRTSTPDNSARHSFIVGNHANRESSPIKEIKRSKYFFRDHRNASNVRKAAKPTK